MGGRKHILDGGGIVVVETIPYLDPVSVVVRSSQF